MVRILWAAAAAACFVGPLAAQDGYGIPGVRGTPDDPKPVYKYELKPENGQYLVVVKTFRGSEPGDRTVKQLAEGLAEYIRSECRLYAYVHETGWTQRQERAKEKAMVLEAMKKHYAEHGIEPTKDQMKIKMARVPDEYTVLVAPGKGELKTLDDALAFAKYVRGLKAPPADFCDAIAVGSDSEVTRRAGEKVNPFLTVIAGRNPTLPKPANGGMPRPKADDFLLSLNAGKKHSLIHETKKDFTLVVKRYNSNTFGTKAGTVLKPGEVMQAGGQTDGELLERAAHQAQQAVALLRSMKYEAYVMHTKYESFVCVGEYDTQDDPRLLANAKALAGELKDQKTGKVLDTFMDKPLPAMIPR